MYVHKRNVCQPDRPVSGALADEAALAAREPKHPARHIPGQHASPGGFARPVGKMRATWQHHGRCTQRRWTAQQRRWLLDEGSLTAHLLAASRGDFFVQVLSQRWGRCRPDEAKLLQIAHGQICLLREVLLVCGGEPWVYARSVLPITSLQGPLRHLRRFGNRPLGQLLFNDPGMHRDPFELAQVSTDEIPLTRATATIGMPVRNHPGRRSRFLLKGKPLIVSEIFLPAFWKGMQDINWGSQLHTGGLTRNPSGRGSRSRRSSNSGLKRQI